MATKAKRSVQKMEMMADCMESANYDAEPVLLCDEAEESMDASNQINMSAPQPLSQSR